MEITKANNYVISLFETFSIEKNQLLGKEWRNALATYDDEVKVVYGILNSIRLSKQNIVVLEDFTNELTAEDRKNQHRFIRLIQYTMQEMKEKRMTEDEHLKLHAKFFREIGMDEDADDLLRVVAEHQAA
jgi:hypothetical protein